MLTWLKVIITTNKLYLILELCHHDNTMTVSISNWSTHELPLMKKKFIQVCTSFKPKIGKYTFNLRFIYFSEMGFM